MVQIWICLLYRLKFISYSGKEQREGWRKSGRQKQTGTRRIPSVTIFNSANSLRRSKSRKENGQFPAFPFWPLSSAFSNNVFLWSNTWGKIWAKALNEHKNVFNGHINSQPHTYQPSMGMRREGYGTSNLWSHHNGYHASGDHKRLKANNCTFAYAILLLSY